MDSAYHVWVNGKSIGYSQGSRNAAEFDISNVIRKNETNRVRVKVYQWSDGSYVEDQDMWVCVSRSLDYLCRASFELRWFWLPKKTTPLDCAALFLRVDLILQRHADSWTSFSGCPVSASPKSRVI